MADPGKKHVVAADDSALDRELLVIASRDSGMQFHQVSHRDQVIPVIAKLARQGITVEALIIDLHMPGIPLPELIAQLRSHESWAQIGVVVMTDSDDESTRDQCLKAGADLFVRKPSNLNALEELLNQMGASLHDDARSLAELS